jgi:hypothetical protein
MRLDVLLLALFWPSTCIDSCANSAASASPSKIATEPGAGPHGLTDTGAAA